jgi:hypothetical protein
VSPPFSSHSLTTMFLLTLPILLLVQFTLSQQCFYPNGNLEPSHKPCNRWGPSASMCCKDGDWCSPEGFCKNNIANSTYINTCTDRTWNDNGCVSTCKGRNHGILESRYVINALIGKVIGNNTMQVVYCSKTAYCCGDSSCCNTNPITASPTPAPTIGPELLSTLPTTSNSTSNSSHQVLQVGLGVGLGVGIPLLLVIGWLIFQVRKLSKPTTQHEPQTEQEPTAQQQPMGNFNSPPDSFQKVQPDYQAKRYMGPQETQGRAIPELGNTVSPQELPS